MSGYNPITGWTHFTATKVQRYYRRVEGRADDLDERIAATGIDYYWDASGGLHVHCDDGRLWEILSGQPATFTSASPADPRDHEEWINVTDIGATLATPPLAVSTVLRLLREEGLLRRVDGRDVPTEAARGLFEEREVGDNWSSRFQRGPKPGVIQRRWSYQVLSRLRTRHTSAS
jgi:hypothetical protein